MTVLLLTEENILFLKHVLHEAFPNCKSSYRSEAMARALGFQTNASLRAFSDAGSRKPFRVARFDCLKLIDRLTELSGEVYASDRIDFCSADFPNPVWVKINGRDQASKDRWFHRCVAYGTPFMFLAENKNGTQIEWDCISINSAHEEHLVDMRGVSLGRAMFAEFQNFVSGISGRPRFDASCFCGTVRGVRRDIAAAIADKFFYMLYGPVSGERVP